MGKKKISHKNPNVNIEKMKQKKISHIRFPTLKKYLGNTIESDVFKIYDRDDDRGPRNRDPKNPTATDREPRNRDRDTTSAKVKTSLNSSLD